MLFDHNISVYNECDEALKKNRVLLIVSATGTGKSHLVAEYLERHDLKGLVVCPKTALFSQWTGLTDRVDVISYSKLCGMGNEALKGYDVYILDEAHHAGSPVWGAAVERLKGIEGKKVIGLTAEPQRYSDGIDVAHTVFDNSVVYGYDIANAVDAKILPKSTFVSAVYDIRRYIGGEVKDEKARQKLIAKLELTEPNVLSIIDILRRHMPNGWRKGVVFVESIADISEAESLLREAFPKMKVFSIHSNMCRRQVDRVMDTFRRVRAGFLVSVDMLNEGLHVPHVNTVVMLRRTESPMIFFQQIGRCLMPGNTKVVIFDLVANYKSLRLAPSKNIQCSPFQTPPTQYTLPEQTIVFDYTRDTFSALDEIRLALSNYWTPEEDDILRVHYPNEGTRCAPLLPRHSPSSISRRASALGIRKELVWTPEMDRILLDYYKSGFSVVRNMIPVHISSSGITNRAHKLGLSKLKHPWTAEEDDILRKYYPIEGTGVASRIDPNISKDAITKRAKKLNIRFSLRTWSDDEIEIVRKFYPIHGTSISSMLPSRSRDAIQNKAASLGISFVKNPAAS